MNHPVLGRLVPHQVIRGHARAGFTLVELVIVIVLAGILGAVAAPRFFDRGGFDALASSDQIKALLRYGQKVAIAQGRIVYAQVSTSGVKLCYDAACSTHVAPAGGSNSNSTATRTFCGTASSWACEGVTSGLTLVIAPAAATFYFDATGKPFAGADVSPTLVSTFASLKLTFSGGGNNKVVTVEPETGYVY